MDGIGSMAWLGMDGWMGQDGMDGSALTDFYCRDKVKGVSFTSSKQASTNGWLDGNKGMVGLALQQLTTHWLITPLLP